MNILMVQKRTFWFSNLLFPNRHLMTKTPNNQPSTIDVASGLALILSVIAFFFSGFAVIQAANFRREQAPSQTGSGGGGFPALSLPSLPAFLDPNRSTRIEPGQFVNAAYRGGGKVEIVSVYRGADVDTVNVRLKLQRVSDRIDGNGDINLFAVKAINTRTNLTYPVRTARTPGNEPISLYQLRPGQSTQATITLNVPSDLQRIDLTVPETDVFRNVPITQPQG